MWYIVDASWGTDIICKTTLSACLSASDVDFLDAVFCFVLLLSLNVDAMTAEYE